MAEYIKRTEALEITTRTCGDYAAAWSEIRKLPAADVAPVVRCKDCKHFKNYGKTSLLMDGKNIKAGWCHRRARYDEEYRMPPDGFCSYGEPKMDGGADHASD